METIIAGKTCYLNATAFSAKGEMIKNVNHTSPDISSDNASFKITNQNAFYIEVKAAEDTFNLASNGGYSLSVHIKENSFPGQTITYSVDWSKINFPDYRGANGSKGRDGHDGRDDSGGFDG